MNAEQEEMLRILAQDLIDRPEGFYFGEVRAEKEQVVDYLESTLVGRHHFRRDLIERIKGYSCGTVACAFGRTPDLFPDKISMTMDPRGGPQFTFPSGKRFPTFDYPEAAMKLFGLIHDEVDALFTPNVSLDDEEWLEEAGVRILSGEAEAAAVGQNILKFTDWKRKQQPVA